MTSIKQTQLPFGHFSIAQTPSIIFPPTQTGLNPKQLSLNFHFQAQTQIEKSQNKHHLKIALGLVLGTGLIALLIVISIVFNQYKNSEYYDLFSLKSTSALCLDGSNAAYHISKTGDPSKILIYFQGGGWCSDATDEKTLEACYQRSFTVLGTSTQQSESLSLKYGSMSKDPSNYFKDWKKVYFHYCDGTGHQGSKRQPILYNGKLLYFRGHNITVERFEDLEVRLGLFSKAEKVVISGESAGGLAATMWTNYLADRVKSGKVYSIVDAGVFYDSPNIVTKTNLYRENFINLMRISNAEISPPVPECLEKFPGSRVDCMLAKNLFPLIKVPLFITQSLYDSYSLTQIIGASCVLDSIPSCNDEEFAMIEENRLNVTSVLQQVARNAQNGVWGIGCVKHQTFTTEEFGDEKYSVSEYSGYTANRAIEEWLEDQDKNNVHLDLLPWPNNRPCA